MARLSSTIGLRLVLPVVALVLVAGNRPAAASAESIEPYAMVRSLQYVQDAVISGDHSAGEMQRHLLTLIDERLRGAVPEDFEDKRNVDAALIYAMSGGNPETLSMLLRSAAGDAFDEELGEGLAIYFGGQPERAQARLTSALRRFRDSPIEAYLALVTANVTALRDRERALRFFDWARLLAPGTIIEEASLRRSAHLAASAGDLDRAMDYSERYVRRFLHSPYASQFVDVFVHAVVIHSRRLDLDRIEEILSLMDASRQREIYLRMARMSTIQGKAELALLAAGRAEALSEDKRDAVGQLASFYAGVASVPTDNLVEAVEKVSAVPDEKLSARDRALRDAARLVAEEVRRRPEPPPTPAATVDVNGAQDGASAQDPETDDASADELERFLAAKRATLQAVDKLLDGTADER